MIKNEGVEKMEEQKKKRDKRIVRTIIMFTLLFVLNFPIRYELKDGGSVVYQSILWRYEKVNSMYEDNIHLVGNRFAFCGVDIVDDVHIDFED